MSCVRHWVWSCPSLRHWYCCLIQWRILHVHRRLVLEWEWKWFVWSVFDGRHRAVFSSSKKESYCHPMYNGGWHREFDNHGNHSIGDCWPVKPAQGRDAYSQLRISVNVTETRMCQVGIHARVDWDNEDKIEESTGVQRQNSRCTNHLQQRETDGNILARERCYWWYFSAPSGRIRRAIGNDHRAVSIDRVFPVLRDVHTEPLEVSKVSNIISHVGKYFKPS